MKSKTEFKRSLILIAVTVMVFGVMTTAFGSKPASASISSLRSEAARLQSQIDANNKKAENYERQGDTLESAIAGFDLKISRANDEISLSQVKIKQLSEELSQAKKELKRQKGLLQANMTALYKRVGASSVELLVASDSFGQFMDQQEYLETLKAGIQDSAEKVVALKKEIETNKVKTEEELEQQEAAKAALASARQEKAQLLNETKGKEAHYRAQMAALEKRRIAVENRLSSMLASGSYVNLGRVRAGQVIGRVGMTGFTFGPHLHFEVRDSGANPINPMSGGGIGHGMTWPLPGHHSIGQYFGCGAPYNWYGRKCSDGTSMHSGLDVSASVGTPIVAAADGMIVHRGNDGDGYGIKVIIRHDSGKFTYYAHLNP